MPGEELGRMAGVEDVTFGEGADIREKSSAGPPT